MRPAARIALFAATALAALPAPLMAAASLESIELGVAGKCKLGAPTLIAARVDDPGDQPLKLIVIAPDNDGLSVATSGEPITIDADRPLLEAIARLGKASAGVTVRLMQGEIKLDERRVRPGSIVGETVIAEPLPPTETLTLAIGINDATPLIDSPTASLPTLAAAPNNWLAYQAFDRVVLLADQQAFSSAGDYAPTTALLRWVKRGGRLILSCGSGAKGLLATGGPLEALAPGTPDVVVPLRSVAPLEAFAESNQRLDTTEPLQALRLTDVRGQVLAYNGPNRDALPLVIRTPLGFGEVVFTSIDLSTPAIAEWAGRDALYDRLLNPSSGEAITVTDTPTSRRGERLLSSALVGFLDSQLPGVSTAPLLAIMGLAALYLLTIGPLDWLLVTRWAGRPQLTWITFPLVVALVGGGVYAGAAWLRGWQCVTASLEVRDIDCRSGDSRSVLLTQLYSPRSTRFDFTPSEPGVEAHTSWFAAADGRLGGLGSGSSLGDETTAGGYTLDEGAVVGLPVATGSTKTLVTHRYAQGAAIVSVTLRPGLGGLIEGSVTNDSGKDLVDCQLWHNGWAWRLGRFRAGETKTINDSGSLLRITTLLGAQLDERDANAQTLASILSFGDLIARRRDPPENHLLSATDLTHQLDLGRAILVGRVEQPKEPLRLVGDARTGKAPQRRDVFVRYLIAVGD